MLFFAFYMENELQRNLALSIFLYMFQDALKTWLIFLLRNQKYVSFYVQWWRRDTN